MKKSKLILFSAILAAITSLSSCAAIGTIFKAGVWAGIIGIVIVVIIIFWIIRKLSNK